MVKKNTLTKLKELKIQLQKAKENNLALDSNDLQNAKGEILATFAVSTVRLPLTMRTTHLTYALSGRWEEDRCMMQVAIQSARKADFEQGTISSSFIPCS